MVSMNPVVAVVSDLHSAFSVIVCPSFTSLMKPLWPFCVLESAEPPAVNVIENVPVGSQ
jgi:hypothetical protein